MKSLNSYSSIIVTGSIAFEDIMNFPGYFKDHFHADKLHQINISYNLTRITKKRVIIFGT